MLVKNLASKLLNLMAEGWDSNPRDPCTPDRGVQASRLGRLD